MLSFAYIIPNVHAGALMLIAWMLAGSTGTLIAGYYKPDWSERTLFGQTIWFQV